MLFPAATETFACTDVKILKEKGICISVHCLRFAAKDSNKMILNRGINDILISHNNIIKSVYGLLLLLLYPSMTIKALKFILNYNMHSFNFLIKSFLL